MKASFLILYLERAGWRQIRQQGIHCILSHPTHANLLSVPDLGETFLQPSLVNDICREAGLKGRVFKKSLSIGGLVTALRSLLGIHR
jgi:predicted RNA binding protein YcfA (HicA-like mRNA interferase family)